MSSTLQNIIIALIGFIAIVFLVRKFIWRPKKKGGNSCENDGCGSCH